MRYRDDVAAETRRTGSRPAVVTAEQTTTRGRIVAAAAAEDAPTEPAHEGDSVQLLVAALRGVDPGTLSNAIAQLADEPQPSPGTRALLSALGQLTTDQAAITPQDASRKNTPGDPPPVSAALVKKIAAAALVLLTFVEPVATQLSQRVFSPNTEIAEQIAVLVEGQNKLQATVLAIAKWTVDVEQARSTGQPMPEPPAPVKLILVQDEMARDTSP